MGARARSAVPPAARLAVALGCCAASSLGDPDCAAAAQQLRQRGAAVRDLLPRTVRRNASAGGTTLFVHVPRTSGLNLLHCLLKPAYPPDEHCAGGYSMLRDWLDKEDPKSPVHGMCSVAASHDDSSILHRLQQAGQLPARVMTVWREPVDRVISSYELALINAMMQLANPRDVKRLMQRNREYAKMQGELARRKEEAARNSGETLGAVGGRTGRAVPRDGGLLPLLAAERQREREAAEPERVREARRRAGAPVGSGHGEAWPGARRSLTAGNWRPVSRKLLEFSVLDAEHPAPPQQRQQQQRPPGDADDGDDGRPPRRLARFYVKRKAGEPLGLRFRPGYGLVASGVDQGSPADRAGLGRLRGRRLRRINGKLVHSLKDARKVMQESRELTTLRLGFERARAGDSRDDKRKPAKTRDVWPWAHLIQHLMDDIRRRNNLPPGETIGFPEAKEGEPHPEAPDPGLRVRGNPYSYTVNGSFRVMPLEQWIEEPLVKDLIHNLGSFQVVGATNHTARQPRAAARARQCVADGSAEAAAALHDAARDVLLGMDVVGLTERHGDTTTYVARRLGIDLFSVARSGPSAPNTEEPRPLHEAVCKCEAARKQGGKRLRLHRRLLMAHPLRMPAAMGSAARKDIPQRVKERIRELNSVDARLIPVAADRLDAAKREDAGGVDCAAYSFRTDCRPPHEEAQDPDLDTSRSCRLGPPLEHLRRRKGRSAPRAARAEEGRPPAPPEGRGQGRG
eukprot:TRINITY_DN4027_c0_g1_i1.p1 TRINITY_DN4027_c0_g1~~TRINITY_DN4027_c0_g1_i1.p1  ORF type:complete len:768 (+),score=209.95 TRINITY_DN4027_c0_g1_i1:82-2304(+)